MILFLRLGDHTWQYCGVLCDQGILQCNCTLDCNLGLLYVNLALQPIELSHRLQSSEFLRKITRAREY